MVEEMHYQHLDHLYPYFEGLVQEYLKECPIEFENPDEARITSFIDSICDEEFSDVLKSKAVLSLIALHGANPNELNNFVVSAIGNINLVGNLEVKKEIIRDSLPPELQTIWENLNHQKIEA
jgi:hypothetical protein